MMTSAITILIFAVSGALAGKLAASYLRARGAIRKSTAIGLPLVGLMVGLSLFTVSLYAYQPQGEPLAEIHSPDQLKTILAESDVPVVIKFHADWCGACRIFEPTVRRSRDQWQGQVKFYAVNVDIVPELARQFSVEALPTLLIMRGGQEYARTLGVQSREKLNDLLLAASQQPNQNNNSEYEHEHEYEHEKVAAKLIVSN